MMPPPMRVSARVSTEAAYIATTMKSKVSSWPINLGIVELGFSRARLVPLVDVGDGVREEHEIGEAEVAEQVVVDLIALAVDDGRGGATVAEL